MKLMSLPLYDAVALVCFFLCWQGYGVIAKWQGRRRPNLISSVNVLRGQWMRRICQRESHIADAALLGNLLRGALFFASTTVFILGGLMAILPSMGQVVSHLPYSTVSEPWVLELKALVLIAVFVYAFFKFTWSAWQYNVLSIIVGAAPTAAEAENATDLTLYIDNAAQIASLAGDSYNNGIRAYYFAISLLAWFIDPLIFLAVTLVVAFVLYRREFSSPMLQSLRRVTAGAKLK